MLGGKCSVVWFRRDLRIEDNPALAAGVREGAVVAVFIWTPEEEGHYYPGRVSRWWLKNSLIHLDFSLRSLGTSLVTKHSSDTVSSLLEVIRSTGATQLFFNNLYDPVSLMRDHRAKEVLASQGINVRTFNADLLYEPWEIRNDDDQPFTTFLSFWEKCLTLPSDPPYPLLSPKSIISGDLQSVRSDVIAFEDQSERASNALLARGWSPGWSNADKALMAFVNGPLSEYSLNRRKADSPTTSFLSPHLHFGEIGVRKVFHLVRMKQVIWRKDGNEQGEESVNLFLKSIGLREYSRYVCFHNPFSHEKPLLRLLKFFPWELNEGYFRAWRQGRTGYPLVDAGMRELWATGWLHDRVRVVVASFFVKVLQLPWRWGMKYFWDTLIDADLETDALGWQYVSGALPDGRAFDRIDHPQIQGYTIDPHGEYVRRWLPELYRLPAEWIHHPWDAPDAVLDAAGIELGFNYPLPIVSIDDANRRLQEAVAEMRRRDTAANHTSEDSSESAPAAFLDDVTMEGMETHNPTPAPNNFGVHRYGDQLVPLGTGSLVEEVPSRTNSDESRAEVPTNVMQTGNAELLLNPVSGVPETAPESSSSSGNTLGSVPVWLPPGNIASEFIADHRWK